MKEYFSHDYNSRNDKKIIKLSMKHGVSGIGIYWCIVEMLYEESGYLNVNEYERISYELRTDYEIVKSVIQDFELFKTDGDLFYSESALNRLNERSEKSQKARESINKRWNKIKNNTNVIRTNNDSNTIKVKESKVKENKVKEVFIPDFLEFKNYAFENQKNTDENLLTLKYKSWVENGWKDGYNKPIKIWKSKLLNTLQYLKTSGENGNNKSDYDEIPFDDSRFKHH